MVIDQASSLHEDVADRAANEFESSFLQVFRHGVAFGSRCRDIIWFLTLAVDGCTVDERPYVGFQASEFFLCFLKCLGIAAYRIEPQPVSD